MKIYARIVAFLLLTAALGVSVSAQNKGSEEETYGKIAKLTQSKKDEDRAKAYQMSKDFLAQYGSNDKDEKVGKIKAFIDNYRSNAFNDALDKTKTAEAFALGKDILAVEPENSYVTMNLAVAGYDAQHKNKDNSYGAQATEYAKQTVSLFQAGKLPKTFQPFKDQPEATANMYYIVGNFAVDSDQKTAAQNFYKAVSIESKIKTYSFPYFVIADYYEKEYARAGGEMKTKFADKSMDDPEVKAAVAMLDKMLANMLDAYARAIKYGEAEKNPSVEAWKQRFSDVYKFAKKSDAGMSEYLTNEPNTAFPDPTTI